MKLTLEKNILLDVLQKVQSIVALRTTLPILSNVLLEAYNGKLKLTTTDLEVSLQTSIDVEIIEEGSTTLPARRFFSICRDLPSHQIEFSIEDEKEEIIIKSGSFEGKLGGLPKSDFPEIPEFKNDFSYTLNQSILKSLLQKTSYAASNDESRPILNGSLMSFKNDKLTVVCTDGRRLALAEQDIEIDESSDIDVVIPSKTVNELIKSLGNTSKNTLEDNKSGITNNVEMEKSDEDVNIRMSTSQIAFEFGNILIMSKLIDGIYPNYQQVIPKQCEERLVVDREILFDAVRRVSLMLNDQAAAVTLEIKENKIDLLTSSIDVGNASESIPVKYNGKEVNIAFNPGYLTAPLKHLDSDEIYFEFSDENSPGLIKSNIPFLYVIMPMRI